MRIQTDGRTRTFTRHSAECGVSYRGAQGWEGRSSRVEIVAAECRDRGRIIYPTRSAKRQRRFDDEALCGAQTRGVESISEREGKGRKNDFDGGAISQRRKGHWNENACPRRLVRQVVLSRLSALCILLVAHMRTLETVIYRRPSSAASSGTSATLPVGVHLHLSSLSGSVLRLQLGACGP
jgi:hypothetical protein